MSAEVSWEAYIQGLGIEIRHSGLRVYGFRRFGARFQRLM